MPRGLTPPEPALTDEVIRLEPLLDERWVTEFERLAGDPEIMRFTRVPERRPDGFASTWVGRYVDGWRTAERAGFAILSPEGGFLGMAAIVELNLPGREGEIGYMTAPEARGRGVAVRALRLVTGWALGDLGLLRVDLKIDLTNEPSLRAAESCGYVREGVLRSSHVKDDVRADVAIYSRLAGDPR